jgi:hypothetical protein
MAAEETTQAATTSTEDHKKNIARQLTGTSFLTLEHIGYFALTVVLPVLLLLGINTALQLWRGNSGSTASDTILPLSYTIEPVMRYVDTSLAVTLTAAFVVLAPFMYVLRRRTAAEYAKRPGYENRVAYKLPVYTALGVLAALATGAFVAMASVFLNSLASIGVKGADIGGMYMTGFLPALLAFLVFGMACWYVGSFAKGRDLSRLFVGAVSLLAGVLAIALFVTTLTINHDTKSDTNQVQPAQPQPYPLQDDSYLRY